MNEFYGNYPKTKKQLFPAGTLVRVKKAVKIESEPQLFLPNGRGGRIDFKPGDCLFYLYSLEGFHLPSAGYYSASITLDVWLFKDKIVFFSKLYRIKFQFPGDSLSSKL